MDIPQGFTTPRRLMKLPSMMPIESSKSLIVFTPRWTFNCSQLNWIKRNLLIINFLGPEKGAQCELGGNLWVEYIIIIGSWFCHGSCPFFPHLVHWNLPQSWNYERIVHFLIFNFSDNFLTGFINSQNYCILAVAEKKCTWTISVRETTVREPRWHPRRRFFTQVFQVKNFTKIFWSLKCISHVTLPCTLAPDMNN